MLVPARVLGLLVAVSVTGLVAAGCSGERDGAVVSAAEDFYAAVASRDGAAACRLLTPATWEELESSSGKSCAAAVVEEVPPSRSTPSVRVSGDAAQARVGSEVAFLALLDDGWHVMAAGCSAAPPAEDLPYECTVSGG